MFAVARVQHARLRFAIVADEPSSDCVIFRMASGWLATGGERSSRPEPEFAQFVERVMALGSKHTKLLLIRSLLHARPSISNRAKDLFQSCVNNFMSIRR